MIIFVYPYIIITICIFAFILISGIGLYFGFKGVKMANGEKKITFSNIRQLEKRFIKAGKHSQSRCVLYLTISLDNYKSLHSEDIAAKLFETLKAIVHDVILCGDGDIMAMYGKSSFVVLSKLDNEAVQGKIESLRKELSKCLLDHSALNIAELAIGSFFVIGSDISFDEAIKRAKQACIHAKNKKIAYSEWNAFNGKALEQKIKRENNIEKEIDNNRFFLVYQPILDAKTKKIIGAEVLSRLNSESDGILPPGHFLSAVDSVGINNKFDYYIFEKTCKWIYNNKSQRQNYRYTINFSRSTLCESDFVERIISTIEKYKLDYSWLVIEILEDKNVIGEEKERMISNLSALKDRGVSFWLDDFGSGYTKFNDMQMLDVAVVKIDRSITQNAVTQTGYIILENIIRTSKNIGFLTLCEGIETLEQEEAVKKAGCDMLQGFYYFKPMPVVEFEELLENKSESK